MVAQHSTLWTCISYFRKVKSERDIFTTNWRQESPKKKKKWINIDKQIYKFIGNYKNRDIISFLRAVTHNIILLFFLILWVKEMT